MAFRIVSSAALPLSYRGLVNRGEFGVCTVKHRCLQLTIWASDQWVKDNRVSLPSCANINAKCAIMREVVYL